jgi:CRP/FNR family transcriptional regulator, cyclic AMP receptor protein
MIIDLTSVLGFAGVALSLASFVMKRMLPLRTIALAANFTFIAFALCQYFERGIDWTVPLPGLILNAILIPLNLRRIAEIRNVAREMARATPDAPLSQWLVPQMKRRRYRAGETIFGRGDAADKLFYVSEGSLTLVEIGEAVGPGDFLGEIGLFSPQRQRTLTLLAVTDGEIYEMTDQELYALYYQDPRIGFHIVRLITARLLRDIGRERIAMIRAPS